MAVLLYKTRVKTVGYPPYNKTIEMIIFAGYSQFKTHERQVTNPRYSKDLTSQEWSGEHKDSTGRLRGTSFEGFQQARKASVAKLQQLKVATTKAVQGMTGRNKKATDDTKTKQQSSLTSVESGSSDV